MNGEPHGYFNCGRGIRQGDPLSPLLFYIVEDVFSRGIFKLTHDGNLGYIPSPRGTTPPSYVFYADDLIVFSRVDRRGFTHLMDFCEKYSEMSRQIVSKEKKSMSSLENILRGNKRFLI